MSTLFNEPRVVIIDTGIANFGSIESAVVRAGGRPSIGRTAQDLEPASHIVLPGVGSFDAAMETLDKRKLRNLLQRKALEEKIPILGICLGMQLLGLSSEEGKLSGLGWFNGRTVRLSVPDLKVPHIGWNRVSWSENTDLFDGIELGARFYFVHSYHYSPAKPGEVIADVEYGERFAAVIQRGNILGTQFHPEKSRAAGLQLIRNFLRMPHA